MIFEDYGSDEIDIEEYDKTSYSDQSSTQFKSEKSSSDEDQTETKELDNNQMNNIVKVLKQTGYENINSYQFKSNEIMNIFNELLITNDGALRMISNTSQISFGFQQKPVLKVEDKFHLGVIDIQYEKSQLINFSSIQQAQQYIEKVPNIPHQKAWCLLNKYQSFMQYLKSLAQDVDEQIELQKDKELHQFSENCYRFLEAYKRENPNQMYTYTIGRINLGVKDIESIHIGYSKEYLNLIGLTEQSLSQIILRKQKIDLMKSVYDITNQTLNGIEQMSCEIKDEVYIQNIVTFDGFPLKLIQKKRNYSDLFKSQYCYGIDFEYIFMVNTMDVDLYDLENLIQYRQRISQSEQNINLDDFLRKELSFQFEDVEYSVHSQSFIEKHYIENINKLTKLRNEKLDQNKRQCKYKAIA